MSIIIIIIIIISSVIGNGWKTILGTAVSVSTEDPSEEKIVHIAKDKATEVLDMNA